MAENETQETTGEVTEAVETQVVATKTEDTVETKTEEVTEAVETQAAATEEVVETKTEDAVETKTEEVTEAVETQVAATEEVVETKTEDAVEVKTEEVEKQEEEVDPDEDEEISYHAVEKEGEITAIWEMQGRKHIRTISARSGEGEKILSLFTSEIHETDAPPIAEASV